MRPSIQPLCGPRTRKAKASSWGAAPPPVALQEHAGAVGIGEAHVERPALRQVRDQVCDADETVRGVVRAGARTRAKVLNRISLDRTEFHFGKGDARAVRACHGKIAGARDNLLGEAPSPARTARLRRQVARHAPTDAQHAYRIGARARGHGMIYRPRVDHGRTPAAGDARHDGLDQPRPLMEAPC